MILTLRFNNRFACRRKYNTWCIHKQMVKLWNHRRSFLVEFMKEFNFRIIAVFRHCKGFIFNWFVYHMCRTAEEMYNLCASVYNIQASLLKLFYFSSFEIIIYSYMCPSSFIYLHTVIYLYIIFLYLLILPQIIDSNRCRK